MGTHCTFEVSDYELLVRLARDDPPAFEALRSEMISDFIEHAPERYRRRLRGIQFRVDAIRRLTHNPLATLIKVQTLMWDNFLRMDQELQKFAHYLHADPGTSDEARWLESDSSPRGRIIELQPYLLKRRGYG